MRAVIQRVREASVCINSNESRRIGIGLVVLVGVEAYDTPDDVAWLAQKIAKLRLFDDEEGVMNRAVTDFRGEALVISQFTLYASTRKGTRPSYHRAASPEFAIPLYEAFVAALSIEIGRPCLTGEFGAHMAVNLTNDGPVTIVIDTKSRE